MLTLSKHSDCRPARGADYSRNPGIPPHHHHPPIPPGGQGSTNEPLINTEEVCAPPDPPFSPPTQKPKPPLASVATLRPSSCRSVLLQHCNQFSLTLTQRVWLRSARGRRPPKKTFPPVTPPQPTLNKPHFVNLPASL